LGRYEMRLISQQKFRGRIPHLWILDAEQPS
jgi:hypothetical protein